MTGTVASPLSKSIHTCARPRWAKATSRFAHRAFHRRHLRIAHDAAPALRDRAQYRLARLDPARAEQVVEQQKQGSGADIPLLIQVGEPFRLIDHAARALGAARSAPRGNCAPNNGTGTSRRDPDRSCRASTSRIISPIQTGSIRPSTSTSWRSWKAPARSGLLDRGGLAPGDEAVRRRGSRRRSCKAGSGRRRSAG